MRIFAILSVLIILNSCGKKSDNYSKLTDVSVPKIVDYNFDVRPILSDKCFNCHGPDAKKRFANLRLDTEEGAYSALKENKNAHAIIPGNPNDSEVYKRITSEDPKSVMPPLESNLTLTKNEKIILKKWIKQGAKYKRHWAFLPISKPNIPSIKKEDWPHNEIDFFIAKKMEPHSLTPNKKADKERLLKRVSFDLTGLPPSVALQEKFLQDNSENAYEKVVDQLLASKHYGEKMTSSWLDVARFADSHGYQDDDLRTMWPWRDWVIHAFNENYGYDKFVTWQLAGDMIPNSNIESTLATGFNRNHKISQEGGIIVEEYRIETLTDRTNTFGKAFLGLTFECAKCHDHKYDPISQKDYYSTFSFFEKTPYRKHAGGVNATVAEPPFLTISNELAKDSLPFLNKKEYNPVKVMVMEERIEDRNTHILNRGVYNAKGEIVTPNLPKSILPFDTEKLPQNRYGLSQWLFNPNNPLTSRVYVNRLWQEFFGVGIVKTSGDFGMQGDLPSHVDLLNWLSKDFQEHQWDIKRLVKMMVTSATYMQSTVVTEEKLAIDPENKYLSRMPRSRYSFEMIRDHVLASSGLLNKEVGGRSVKTYQPEGMWKATSSGRGLLATYTQDHNEDLYRRGIYMFFKRTSLPPVPMFFDANTRDQCEVSRSNTMTPLQALIMLNDPTVLEAARVYSEKLNAANNSISNHIETAFRTILCRNIKPTEKQLFLEYYQQQEAQFKEQPQKAKAFIDVGEYPIAKNRNTIKVAALMQVIHTMYNMEETIIKT